MVLANADPTTSTIFQPVCQDPRLQVVCIAFTRTLTKSQGFWRGVSDVFRASGFGYFAYIAFCNVVFRLKEWLIWYVPGMGRIFRGFFSLRLWARQHCVETVASADFNSTATLDFVQRHRPDILFTRINQILKEPILKAPPYGCWCFHSSALPKYQGIAAEFHSLLNGEESTGFTVMQMEQRLDAGPIIAQESYAIPRGVTLHGLIDYNTVRSHSVVRRAVEAIVAGEVRPVPQDLSRRSYYSWPSPDQTRAFRRKGLRYISISEAVAYVLQ
jgi:folate-dependent phosphoribosylglycinamide formyltransferase PurN